MNQLKKTSNPEEDTRSLLKHQHKKVYSICRLFADNYKEHQGLFARVIAGAHLSLGNKKEKKDKQVLFLRACINMAALHSLTRSLSDPAPGAASPKPGLQFKSPDFQKSILQFRTTMGELQDYEKILLFLRLEEVPPGEISEFSGSLPVPEKAAGEERKKSFIPYLKEKLIWI